MYVGLYMQLCVMLPIPIIFLITSIYPLRDENLGQIELIHISIQFLKLFLVRQGLHAWLSLVERSNLDPNFLNAKYAIF